MKRVRGAAERGMTLIEMLVALVVFSIVIAGALGFMRSQGRAFTLGNQRMSTLQNLRFALNLMAQDLRALGAGVPDEQPMLVYAGPDVVAFNANHTTNLRNDVFAVYYDPDAPSGAVSALTKALAITIPNTAVTYPDTSYLFGGVNSPAETIVFFFRPDTTTSRTDDYVIYRQVNRGAPELVARNILKTPGTDFFEYYVLVTPASGEPTTQRLPAAELPLVHSVPIHGSPADTGSAAKIDSVRAIRINLTGTNGLTGPEERQRSVSRLVRLPNAGLAVKRTCGDEPLLGTGLVASVGTGPGGVPVVNLTWGAAVDETGGEGDVVSYVIWRRLQSESDWGDPYLNIPAGAAPYVYQDAAVVSGESYVYALAAQDCTPLLSQLAISNVVTIP
ncbi:MAG: hypothetical protein KatS3mg081_1943 [Gemmatimonadales bacterium]|nr:hypothetical protein HRbin33_01282 [bacterium HR33]GIW52588.1 MAG: hypothetical protein KatS3mg081_1943 [Gemmatimonadales bacterium]